MVGVGIVGLGINFQLVIPFRNIHQFLEKRFGG
jgi:hypothetical protein